MSGIINKIAVPDYNAGTTYAHYDVVKSGAGNYYVSPVGGNVGNAPGAASTTYWKRFGNTDFDFSTVWSPDNGSRFNMEPRVVEARVGRGGVKYRQRDGVNTKLLGLELRFNDRNIKITKSLMAFFEFIGSKYAFYYTLPEPYSVQKLFTCKKWSLSYNAYGQQTISSTFLQEPTAILTSGMTGAGQSYRV